MIMILKDKNMAIEYYKKAARQGYEPAKEELRKRIIITTDPVKGTLREEGINLIVQDSLKIEIKNRIELWNRLLNLDSLTFIEKETTTLIEALQTALYDEKAKDDRWIDDGETSDIDSLDSFNYSFEFWFNEISYCLGKVA